MSFFYPLISTSIFSLIISLLLNLCNLSAAQARPLELVPRPEKETGSYSVAWRSDLWTTPDHNKASPLRIYDLGLDLHLLESPEQHFFFKVDIEGLGTGRADLTVGKRQILVGSDLRSQAASFGYIKNLSNASWLSASVAYTSDSDEPYQQGRSSWTEVTATYAFEQTDDHQWFVMMNYSKNRGYLNNSAIPLLGVLYHLSPALNLKVGFPFVQVDHQGEQYKTQFVATATGVRLKTEKNLTPRFDISGQTGYSTRSYLHINRLEDDLRLFYEEIYLETAAKAKLSERTSFALTIGYSFNRDLYEAKQIYLPSGSRTKLPGDYYGSLRFEVNL